MDRNIAALLREDTTTVEAQFYQSHNNTYGGKVYKYVTHLDFQAGDLAVVLVNDEYKVVYISAVHKELEVEPNSSITYKWIVSKVDFTGYSDNLLRNRQIEDEISKGFRTSARAQYRAMVAKDNPTLLSLI